MDLKFQKERSHERVRERGAAFILRHTISYFYFFLPPPQSIGDVVGFEDGEIADCELAKRENKKSNYVCRQTLLLKMPSNTAHKNQPGRVGANRRALKGSVSGWLHHQPIREALSWLIYMLACLSLPLCCFVVLVCLEQPANT